MGQEAHCVLLTLLKNQTLNSDKHNSRLDWLNVGFHGKHPRGSMSFSIWRTLNLTYLQSQQKLVQFDWDVLLNHVLLPITLLHRVTIYFDSYKFFLIRTTWILWKPVKTTDTDSSTKNVLWSEWVDTCSAWESWQNL